MTDPAPYPPPGPWSPTTCTTRADCIAAYAASEDTWRKTQAQRDADVVPGHCVQCGGRIAPPAHMIQPVTIQTGASS